MYVRGKGLEQVYSIADYRFPMNEELFRNCG